MNRRKRFHGVMGHSESCASSPCTTDDFVEHLDRVKSPRRSANLEKLARENAQSLSSRSGLVGRTRRHRYWHVTSPRVSGLRVSRMSLVKRTLVDADIFIFTLVPSLSPSRRSRGRRRRESFTDYSIRVIVLRLIDRSRELQKSPDRSCERDNVKNKHAI